MWDGQALCPSLEPSESAKEGWAIGAGRCRVRARWSSAGRHGSEPGGQDTHQSGPRNALHTAAPSASLTEKRQPVVQIGSAPGQLVRSHRPSMAGVRRVLRAPSCHHASGEVGDALEQRAGRGQVLLKRARAGSLEAAVLGVLWDHGGWLTPGEVRTALGSDHPVSYTTVMTVLVRLWKKASVERHKVGRSFAYRPRQTREEYVARRMDALLAAAADRPAALGHFIELLDERERDQLQRFLRAKAKP